MKFAMRKKIRKPVRVASFAEAWIEIIRPEIGLPETNVASFAEAWIEIGDLKEFKKQVKVASFAEAWIEMW